MENREVISYIFKFMHLHRQKVHAILENDEDNVFYAQLPLLKMIQENGSCTQKEIAERFEVSPAFVTKTIQALEKKGMVQRVCDPNDQRCLRISVTEKALVNVKKHQVLFDELDKRIFENVSEEEKEQLVNILEKINNNLEKECK